MWRWGVVSGCPPQHQPSSFFLLISSLLSQSSSLHELLSFPLAGNESCCLWCEGEPGGGNNGAERKCQPWCTRVRACLYVFSVCVCVPSHGLLKIPFAVQTKPLWTPAEELSSAATIKEPCSPVLPLHLSPPLSFISSCRVISVSSAYSLSLFLSVCINSYLLSFPLHLTIWLQERWLSEIANAASNIWKCVRFQGWASSILNSPSFCPFICPQKVNIPALILIVVRCSIQL